MLDPVPGGPERGLADLLGRGGHPGRDRGHRGVADRVEAGLQAGPGAQHDVLADLVHGQVPVAVLARSVHIGLAEAGGVRADRAVGEQVAGRAERAELAGGVHTGRSGLPPVREDRRQPARPGPAPAGRAGRRCRTGRGRRARARADAELRGPGQRGPLEVAALAGGHRVPGGAADGVVGVAGQVAGVGPAGQAARLGHGDEQGRGDHRGVDVDPGQVDHRPVRGPVQLGAGRRPALRPAGLVPAVAEQRAAAGGAGGPLDPVERVGRATRCR